MKIRELGYQAATKAKKYYVYECYVDGEVRYVGKGKGTRWTHCTSGKSSCANLNRDFFAGKELKVVKVEENLMEQDAFNLETKLIEDYEDQGKCLYNKTLYPDQQLKLCRNPDISRTAGVKILSNDEKVIAEKLSDKIKRGNDSHYEDLLVAMDTLGLSLYLVSKDGSKPFVVVDREDEVAIHKAWWQCLGQFMDGDQIIGDRD